ncbi:hypothetical protein TMatcc_009975 [Talaromyces marneffei ATCC 18224]|uniref:Muramidase n=1 Tax=Talaromyces marneffei (strain ATCC 18224 / CBS 334.59 / QM 7333) TaxID=441960 RepID=B6QTU9_TALMQ|nr:uncharacterized protein EYB26_009193 [Talaromyces marneffei]EEA19834.1 hypothetical protein PMAA_006020 [Talaromyces marneffei ATCC 18224]KAE8548135.1 hypothetical protein EYB25_009929 [Talaromyces marneffei]QGA21482.1 hypothetical protein EYB26_009193 [Talaromyces marneffei]
MHLSAAVFYSLVALASAAPLPGRHVSVRKDIVEDTKRTLGSVVSSAVAVITVNDNDGIANGVDQYTQYAGDGSVAAGWPSSSQWVSFQDMWETSKPSIATSCAQFNQPNPTDEEITNLHEAIQQVARQTFVDHRFILAIIMQESKGCLRAPTTNWGVNNPGLMQDHGGTGTCYGVNPCPRESIVQMLLDGTSGTETGDGLASLLDRYVTAGEDGGMSQVFYKAARAYNSGSVAASGNLQDGGATPCYASDVANRLTGWVSAGHACSL